MGDDQSSVNDARSDYAIEVRGLSKVFGGFKAVDSVNFNVLRGEVFGFLGPNGAGKSTTIRMLCGLVEPTSGTALVDGFDVIADPDAIRTRIGYMSQKFSLYEDLTVEENIRFFGGVYGLSGARVRERLKWVVSMAGLEGMETRLTGTLSGGWRQRLALGCAIIHEPGIVFLDEPTAGVDPVSRRNFWDLIGGLSEKGVTTLVTTHYLDEAEYCNNIVMINDGRIMAEGSPKELKERHVSYDLYELLVDDPARGIDVLRGQPWTMEVSLFGTYLRVGTAGSSGAELVKSALDENGVVIERMGRVSPSLEDVFIRVLGEEGVR